MLSFQEIMDKTVEQRKRISEVLQSGSYHPELETGNHEPASLTYGLKPADERDVKESFDRMTLAEVLVRGSSAMGGDDLIAAKVHDTLVYAAKPYDLCGLCGYVVDSWQGSDLKVDVVVDGSYSPKKASSYGKGAEANVATVQCTVKPATWTLPVVMGSDLVEDEAFGLVQYHVEKAGEAMGKLATDEMLRVLKSPPDGDGTANTEGGSADETLWLDVQNAYEANARDKFTSNTMIVTEEAWTHSITKPSEVAGGAAGDYGWHSTITYAPPTAGFDCKFEHLDVKFCNSDLLHAAGDTAGGAMTDCVTLVFDRGNAILTGRKRWLEIHEFANPLEDIEGAVVSSRFDSVTLYKDATCVITET